MISASQSENAPLHIGRVALAVRDLDRVADFYRAVVGLREVGRTETGLLLGAGDVAFLELKTAPDLTPSPAASAGLFHTAFLLPSREALGRWLHHASANGIRLEGASDHGVSEAVYFTDPEGNGIEIYADRPKAEWPYENGGLQMTTRRMSLPSILEAAGSCRWNGAPDGTHVGHIHLRVGDLHRAADFYHRLVGLDMMVELPAAAFLSSGGYHHHVAANVWHSRGASPRSRSQAGLASFELLARDGALLDALAGRLSEAEVEHERDADGLRFSDADGNDVRVTLGS